MSISFWLISGIGIDAEEIREEINTAKLVWFLTEQCPDDTELKTMLELGDFSAFDLDDYLYGCCFDNLADILCHCDETDTLTYGSDCDGRNFFYYPPSMPWDRVSNEPQSKQEVIDRIIAAVQKITDLSDEQIMKIIDTDLYVVGCG